MFAYNVFGRKRDSISRCEYILPSMPARFTNDQLTITQSVSYRNKTEENGALLVEVSILKTIYLQDLLTIIQSVSFYSGHTVWCISRYVLPQESRC